MTDRKEHTLKNFEIIQVGIFGIDVEFDLVHGYIPYIIKPHNQQIEFNMNKCKLQSLLTHNCLSVGNDLERTVN